MTYKIYHPDKTYPPAPFDTAAAFADTGPSRVEDFDDPSSVKVLNPEEAHQQAQPISDLDRASYYAATGDYEGSKDDGARLDTPEADERRNLEKAVKAGREAIDSWDVFLRCLRVYDTAAPDEYRHLIDVLTDAVDRFEVRLDRTGTRL